MIIYFAYTLLLLLWLFIYYKTNFINKYKIIIGLIFLVLPIIISFLAAIIVGDKPNP